MNKGGKRDKRILEDIIKGGQAAEAALRRVYLEHRTAIDRLIRKNRGTAEEAKDVMQEAVLAFYENVKQGRFKGDSTISTYLFSIARYIWLNQLKRKQIEVKKLEASAPSDFEPALPKRITESENKRQMLALFSQLGQDCQQVLLESIYEGYDMKTIAQNMGFDNEQVARNKKYLCLKKLKAWLKAKPELLHLLNPKA